jgi:hypothetical protein
LSSAQIARLSFFENLKAALDLGGLDRLNVSLTPLFFLGHFISRFFLCGFMQLVRCPGRRRAIRQKQASCHFGAAASGWGSFFGRRRLIWPIDRPRIDHQHHSHRPPSSARGLQSGPAGQRNIGYRSGRMKKRASHKRRSANCTTRHRGSAAFKMLPNAARAGKLIGAAF